MEKKSKVTSTPLPPQIHITIEPKPLPEGTYYVHAGDLSREQIREFRLAWEKMNRESGQNSWCIVLPHSARIEEATTELLRHLHKKISDELIKRGGAV